MKKFRLLMALGLYLGAALSAFSQNANIQLRSSIKFPGQTLANVCGYTAPDGREYGLVGASQGMIIVDVTYPDAPVQIVQIPGPDNLWKEIKVYKNYAFITSEGGGGFQIVDLSGLPSPNLKYHNYMGDGAIAGQLNSIHALHIDTSAGFVYGFGSQLFSGGAVVCDLNADPYNPKYVGFYNQLGYVHDGFADKDTLYAGHINAGYMAIVDMRDKSNPILLGSIQTPARFTHNIWLTDDHRYALTTDERGPSFLTAYDVTDPSDIKEVDRMQTTPGSGSIVHNTHIRNDWAITSWYTDGFNIVDVHRPINLVQVGRYDTWSGSGSGFDGCWGVFPFFPSGTIIASNIENEAELFVLSPTYKRACYLEGTITDGCSQKPLAGASIRINGGDQLAPKNSDAFGIFRTGQSLPGTFSVTVSKAGYPSKTFNVVLTPGEVTKLDATLETQAYSVKGSVKNAVDNQPVPFARVSLTSPTGNYNLVADAAGKFDVSCVLPGTYDAAAGLWGFKPSPVTSLKLVDSDANLSFSISPGYYDDYALDYGWKAEATATSGFWVREEPDGTSNQGNQVNTEEDSPLDGNGLCYVTGNGGGQSGNDDVDGGSVTLTSPAMKLSNWQDAILSYQYWFYNGGGQGGSTPNDKFEVLVTNGSTTVPVATVNQSESDWRASGDISLGSLITLTDDVRVIFRATDDQPGHLVEAAVDIFSVVPGTVGASDIDENIRLGVAPNPSSSDFAVNFNFETGKNARLLATNLLGVRVFEKTLSATNGSERLGSDFPAGVYFISVENDGKMSRPVKVVKQ